MQQGNLSNKGTFKDDPALFVPRKPICLRYPVLYSFAMDNCTNCRYGNFGLGGRGVHLVIPSVIAPMLALLLVTNRVYWRLRLVGSLGLDDLSTIASTIFLFVQCSASVAAVNFGYGRPFNSMNVHQAALALRCFFLLQIFYKLTINCTKLSILFLYIRIFTDRPWFVRTCWGLILFVSCACLCFTSVTVFQCSPVRRAWDRWSVEGTCLNLYTLWYSNAIYNILTDLIIVLMVPPVIFTLRLPIRQKLALTCIFGLGVIVCAASISRLTTLYSSAYGGDLTAGSLVSTIWTTIEAGLGVICANLPMLRPTFQRFFPRLFPSRSSADPNSTSTPSHHSGVCNSSPPVAPRTSTPILISNEGTPYDQLPVLAINDTRNQDCFDKDQQHSHDFLVIDDESRGTLGYETRDPRFFA
ncbi:hypothetical protein ABEF92_006337 [Exophiala dermatitidis]|uniref:Phosphatidylserine decarboxylase n=2 Tax=Exophiala dermatitidis TaxID=5970 RepID=H6C6C1_EXODN|nr:phosphatidylserine decarboxylase [Exophiala dermatitidis NIH/UT8656]EHY59267.1 phosphatidylserine decarboxylase [Exophiala dermatitidis NIH/UT8656]